MHFKQSGELTHTAEIGSLAVNAATASAGVVVDAPPIGTHHVHVLLTLLRTERIERLRALIGVQATTGATGIDAPPAVTTRHGRLKQWERIGAEPRKVASHASVPPAMGFIDFHLIANFAALALITLAGPAVIFILFYRRGAL